MILGFYYTVDGIYSTVTELGNSWHTVICYEFLLIVSEFAICIIASSYHDLFFVHYRDMFYYKWYKKNKLRVTYTGLKHNFRCVQVMRCYAITTVYRFQFVFLPLHVSPLMMWPLLS